MSPVTTSTAGGMASDTVVSRFLTSARTCMCVTCAMTRRMRTLMFACNSYQPPSFAGWACSTELHQTRTSENFTFQVRMHPCIRQGSSVGRACCAAAHLVPSEQQLPHEHPADAPGGAAHEHRREAGL